MGEERRTNRTGRDPTENRLRLTVHDAARRLGVSEDAVRMRVKRGTLSSDKEGGRLYVLLDTEPTAELTPDRTDELIEELRGRVHSLEDQLGQERDANRENRRIIAALTSRIPELEAPSSAGPPGEPEAATGMPMGPATSEASEGARVGSESPQEPLHEQQRSATPWWLVALFGLLLVGSVAFLAFFAVLVTTG